MIKKIAKHVKIYFDNNKNVRKVDTGDNITNVAQQDFQFFQPTLDMTAYHIFDCIQNNKAL